MKLFDPYNLDFASADLPDIAPLTLTKPDMISRMETDDFTADTSTTGEITIGGTATGRYNGGGDIDWFAVTVTAGDVVRFDTSFTATDAFPFISLFNASGEAVASGAFDSTLSYDFSSAGTYYVEVTDGGDSGYDYTLSATQITDDFSGSITTTGVLTADVPATGQINFTGDADWFAFDATAGQVFDLNTTRDDGFEFLGSTLVYDANGTLLQDLFQSSTYNFTEAGRYYIAVDSGPAGSSGTNYTLTATEVVDDFGQDIAGAGTLELDAAAISGAIEFSGDQDWLRIDVQAGEIISFLAASSDGRITLTLADGTGLPIDSYTTSSFGNPLNIGFDAAATYYVQLSGNFTNDTALSYEVTANSIQDDYLNNATTSGAFAIGDGGVTGQLDYRGDADWFAIDVQADDLLVLRTNSSLTGSFAGVEISIFDTDGNLVVETQGGDTASTTELVHTLATSGTYYVQVAAASTLGEGSYTLTAETVNNDLSADNETTSILAIDGEAITSAIEYRTDSDWHAISVAAEGYVEFLANFTNNSAAASLVIFDANGNEVATGIATNENDPLGYYFEDAGQYFISIESNATAAPGDYTLSARSAEAPSPLSAIDWGSYFEGAGEGVLTLNVYFGGAGESFSIEGESIQTTAWQTYEIEQVLEAMAVIEEFIAVDFVRVDNPAQANLMISVDAAAPQRGLLGVAIPQGEPELEGSVVFFRDGEGWDEGGNGGLERGGFGFNTILHELGHALGLAHPHDTGGSSDIIDGFGFNAFRDTGDFGLNQSVFTVMSYVAGWESRPGPSSSTYDQGWVGSLAPFDIAVLQDAYGATERNAGDTVYNLTSGTDALTYYTTIWDTGGTDIITADGATDYAFIDLAMPNLRYAYGGGGEVSGLINVVGGYTIAPGVIIENARGADFGDLLYGNRADNHLSGQGGGDFIYGRRGNDTLLGDIAPSLEVNSVEAQIFRAYQAVFDRAPDLGGFNLFAGEVRAGRLSQAEVIAEFVSSAEFTQSYGELNNAAFVEQLFTNVLPGNTDQQGRDNYIEALEAGTLTRPAMVIELANAPEFLLRMELPSAAFATNMIIHPAEGQVFRIYQAVFDRAPDLGGFTAFVNSIQAGVLTVEQITAEFVASQEFQDTYGNLSNAAFVNTLYDNVLPGNQDQQGRTDYAEALTAGTLTREAMVAEFVESAEFRGRTSDAAEAFARTIFTDNGDTLSGGRGDDMIFGGRGADVFEYDVTTDGADVVLDFTLGVDQFRLLGAAAFGTFAEVMAAGQQVGNDTVFDFGGGNTITLTSVMLDDLTAAEFGFETGASAQTSGKALPPPVMEDTPSDAADLMLMDEEPDWVIDALI